MNIFTTEARKLREDPIPGTSDRRVVGAALECSCDHPITRPIECHPGRMRASVSATRTIYAFARTAGRLAAAALREIFDESAYDRYLARTQSERSVASYRAFVEERQTGIARRPRCC